MTIERVKEILNLCKGTKITHRHFSKGEYIYRGSDGVLKCEKGYNLHEDEFWSLRRGEGWKNGWMLYDYIFWSPSYPLRCKIGIARNVPRRRRQVSRSIGAKVYRVVAVPVLGAYSFEQLFHAIFFFARVPIERTNGGTEWFHLILPLAVVGVVGVFIVQFALIAYLAWYLLNFNI